MFCYICKLYVRRSKYEHGCFIGITENNKEELVVLCDSLSETVILCIQPRLSDNFVQVCSCSEDRE